MYFPAQNGKFPKYVAPLEGGGTLFKSDRNYISEQCEYKVKCTCRSRATNEPRKLTLQCTSMDDSMLNYAIDLAYTLLQAAALIYSMPLWAQYISKRAGLIN